MVNSFTRKYLTAEEENCDFCYAVVPRSSKRSNSGKAATKNVSVVDTLAT